MNGNVIDMRMFAQRAGASVSYPAGSIVFKKDDPGSCMYIVQSGVIEMIIGDMVVETCGPNEAIGFMSMVDGAARSSTARVKETCELSLIDLGPAYGNAVGFDAAPGFARLRALGS